MIERRLKVKVQGFEDVVYWFAENSPLLELCLFGDILTCTVLYWFAGALSLVSFLIFWTSSELSLYSGDHVWRLPLAIIIMIPRLRKLKTVVCMIIVYCCR